MKNILVFDIETIPDTATGRRIHDLGEELSDEDVARAMTHLRQQKTGSDFLPPHLQRIVAISVVLQTPKQFRLWSLGEVDSPEADLVGRFFAGVHRYTPELVSWNGSGFDLPVLHYRALRHGIPAPHYWEIGDMDRDFRYNNYLGRFHWRHLDLMDVLAGYQNRAFAPLDEIAILLDLPGKMGMHGSHVFSQFLAGEIQAIRDYCETDVLNTYLIYLRFELLRGHLQVQDYQQAQDRLRDYLACQEQPHLQAFLQAWPTQAE